MKFELKNVNFYPRLSEETNCFVASLYVDGKMICTVKNDGHGGCDMHELAKGRTRAELQAVHDWVKANVPARDYEGITIQPDLDTVVDELLMTHLATKDLTKLLKGKIVAKVGEAIICWAIPPAKLGECRERLLKAKPGAEFLNDMPFEQALEIYRKTA